MVFILKNNTMTPVGIPLLLAGGKRRYGYNITLTKKYPKLETLLIITFN